MLEKIFPGLATKRERAKLELEILQKQRDMVEHLPSFARDNDEDSWISILGSSKEIKTEHEIDQMQRAALKVSLTPHGRNAIDTMESFVIGKEAKITAIGFEDEEKEDGKETAGEKKLKAIQEYWDGFAKPSRRFDRSKKRRIGFDLTSKQLLRRTIRDGESFLRIFNPETNPEMKEVAYPKLRFVEPLEIKHKGGKFTYGIETSQEDIEEVVTYHRTFQKKQSTSDISTTEETEEIPANEIIHTKILVDSNVKRGISFLIGVAEYMAKHMDWLDGRITLNKMRSIWNIIGEVEGAGNIGTITNSFSDVTGKTAPGGTAKKKAPKSGTILYTRGIKYKYDNLNIKAQDTKDDGRAIQLMIALGLQFPEYIATGDASNSNFASTMVSESPFVRMIEKYQDIFAGTFKEVFFLVTAFGVANGQIKDVTEADLEKVDCQIDFDTLIHRDIEKETKAFSLQKADGALSIRTYSAKLGLDFEDEQTQIKKEDEEDEGRELDRERRLNQNNPNNPNNRNRNPN